jgi:TRAP-type C4-dicarboxylate transport system permease small subunit
MRRLIRSAARQLGVVSRVLESGAMAVSVVLLLALLLLMNVEVAARYLFNSSTLLADEYSGYLYTWMVLLGAVHLLRSDRYLSMTSIIERMSPRVQNLFGVFGAIISFAVASVCVYTSWALVKNSYLFGTRSIQPTATPLVLVQAVLPLGFGLLCLAYLEEILRRLAGLRPRRAEDDPDTYGIGEIG